MKNPNTMLKPVLKKMLRGGKMPCGACAIGFNRKPCEHQTDNFDDEDLKRYVGKLLPRHDHDGYVECMVDCFKELYFNCPCRECLVKVTCNLVYEKRCDQYKDLINKVNKKHYDETTGAWRNPDANKRV
jgi:hypothetical protein